MPLELVAFIGLVFLWVLYLFHRQLGKVQIQLAEATDRLESIDRALRGLSMDSAGMSSGPASEQLYEMQGEANGNTDERNAAAG